MHKPLIFKLLLAAFRQNCVIVGDKMSKFSIILLTKVREYHKLFLSISWEEHGGSSFSLPYQAPP